MKVTPATLLAALCASVAADTPLPVVDLGYELQQASNFNATGNYYNFSNIRYAAPPLGNLRFAAPQAPAVNRSAVQNGQIDRICYQAQGDWFATAVEFVGLYLSGEQTTFNTSSLPVANVSLTPGPTETEDCLFLDVITPKNVFNKTGNGAPVIVWIYGGGFAQGSKTSSGDPAGLISRSQLNNDSGVVYVALNYRLGAIGWLSGGEVQANGSANAGLLDQRFALEWVQKNIHLFGGDPSRVTVFGESAGGSSVMHQITAYGGSNGNVPFAQALSQSPAFLPNANSSQQETQYQEFLSFANVSTLAELRDLSSAAIQNANARTIAVSPWGQYTFGPVVDGTFVPDLPGKLLENGQFDKSLRVMTAHNGNEGLLFTSPYIQNNTDFANFVITQFPSLSGKPDTLSYITDVLYPPVFDGTYGYTDQIGRAAMFVGEPIIGGCNSFYLNKAFNNQTHSYLFDILPALHAEDVPYTFYNGNGSATATSPAAGVTEPEVALALQSFIGRFAETGDPNGPGLPYFPIYQNNATVLVLNGTTFATKQDPLANQRCDWWQQALYY